MISRRFKIAAVAAVSGSAVGLGIGCLFLRAYHEKWVAAREEYERRRAEERAKTNQH